MSKKKFFEIIVIAIVFIALLGSLFYYINESIYASMLNNMYADIKILDNKIAIYYIENGSIPIQDEKIEFNNSINPNDNEVYYKIDLSKLIDLSLIYGKDYEEGDYYIINEKSHTVYYYKGIEYRKVEYYTRNLNYEKI